MEARSEERQGTEATRPKATTCDKGTVSRQNCARRLPRTATCEFGFLLRGPLATNGCDISRSKKRRAAGLGVIGTP